MRTDDLITQLATGLRPVRRVWHPLYATTAWVGVAALILGVAVMAFGLRPDIAGRLAEGFDTTAIVTAIATGILSALAAFELALPDRDRRWALLPLPTALAWLSTMGWGCLQDLARFGPDGLRLTTSFSCLAFIAGLGLPLTLVMLWLARHAAWFRPGPVAALGGLSAAAFASAGLTLIHYLDAAVMVLVWHGVSMTLVVVTAKFAGPALMRREGRAA